MHRSAYAAFHIGGLLMRQERYLEAINHYSDSIASNGRQTATYGNRGVAYSSLGKHEEAVKDFTYVIAVDPHDAKAFLNRGYAYH